MGGRWLVVGSVLLTACGGTPSRSSPVAPAPTPAPALWTLRGDKLEGEDKKYTFSPFWTVAVAFFFAEMGDKTQLATVALAAKYHSIIPIWLGTTAGMMVADAFGIIVGVVLGKKIPERVALEFCHQAMQSGAAGVDMGRNIFQSAHPAAMIQAVRAIVHKGLGPREALGLFEELARNGVPAARGRA